MKCPYLGGLERSSHRNLNRLIPNKNTFWNVWNLQITSA
jgi:hypothetical protein